MGRSFEEISQEITAAESRRDLAHLQRLADELSAHGTPTSEATILYLQGAILQITGDARAGIEHQRRGIAICEEHGLDWQRSRHLMGIGIAQLSLGELDEALVAFRIALDHAEATGDNAARSSAIMSIGIVHGWKGDYDAALTMFRQAYDIDEQRGDELTMAKSLNNMAVTYWNTGDLPQALAYFLRALDINERHNNQNSAALCYLNIGNVYVATGNNDTALDYLQKAVTLSTKVQDAGGVAMAVFNIATTYLAKGEHERALTFARDANKRFSELHDQQGIARSTVSLCAILLAMKEYDQARAVFAELDGMKIDDPRYASQREQVRADLLAHDGDLTAAVEAATRALSIATDHSLRTEEVASHKQLRDLARKNNDLAAYVDHNERYTELREEILGREATHRMAIQESERTIAAERAERERERSVLHSTLPKEVAERVARGEVVNDHYDNATVIFLDIVGFTELSSTMSSQEVITLLDDVFTQCDAICKQHNVTKIKTIGDSYMCVSFDSVINAALCALEMSRITISHEVSHSVSHVVEFRIGIHCGPVTAGVIGKERMQYDVWGDTVNVASRMESTGEAGRVHVSEAFASNLEEESRIKDQGSHAVSHNVSHSVSHASVPQSELVTRHLSLVTQLRGSFDIKGKGLMNTYWLEEGTE